MFYTTNVLVLFLAFGLLCIPKSPFAPYSIHRNVNAENNVVRRKTRSARANYLACQQPLYGLKKRRGLWCMGVWGDEGVQTELDGVERNNAIFEKIASSLANHEYHRTWQQCKTKIKNMTSTLYK